MVSGRVFSTKHHEEFLTEVSRAVRGAEATHPAVKKLATEIQGIHADLLRLAKEYGVEGFENVAENLHYLNRRWNYRAIRALKEKIGTMHFERFLANAIVSGTKNRGRDG